MSFHHPLAKWLLAQHMRLTEWRAFRAHLSANWLAPEFLDASDLDIHLRVWRRGQRNQEQRNG